MHACGHDGHMACLCGAAKVLAQHRDDLRATVKLIFQPGEELAGGARCMVEQGVMEDVDAVFGLHGWPGLAVGKVGVRSGTIMACARFFRITIEGKGCHGADPAVGIDPIVAAAHVITALQTVASRELDPAESCVVTIGRFAAGTTGNIIPDAAVLEGTIRALTVDSAEVVMRAVERIARDVCGACRAAATVAFGEHAYPPVVNDPVMTDFARDTLSTVLGPDSVAEIDRPSMTAEDFAFYLHKAPGAFLWLGLAPAGVHRAIPLHNARFDFNDEAIPPGIHLLTALALRFPPAR